MKRVVLLFALAGGLLLSAFSTVDAQVKFGFGPRIGFNLGGMSFDPDQSANIPSVSKTGRFGMMFGGVGEVEFGGMFAGELGIIYVMKGGGYSQSGQAAATVTLDEKFSELCFPILFKVKFLRGPFHPYGFVGPNLGIILSATETLTNAQGTKDTDLKNLPNVGSVISGMDFSLDFGGGAEYMLSKNMGVQVDMRYSLGLSNIWNEPAQQQQQQQQQQPAQTTTWHTHGFQIMLGTMFYL